MWNTRARTLSLLVNYHLCALYFSALYINVCCLCNLLSSFFLSQLTWQVSMISGQLHSHQWLWKFFFLPYDQGRRFGFIIDGDSPMSLDVAMPHHALWPLTLDLHKVVCYLLWFSPSTPRTWDVTTTQSSFSNIQITPPSTVYLMTTMSLSTAR